jgi:hypothetical protein
MPQSYVQFTGNGSNRTFSFAGIDDYLSTGYLKVYINDVVVATTNYTIDTTGGNENVVFTVGYGAPANGAIVRIARETPNTSAGFAANIVDFSDGSVLTATDLDKGFKGLLHIVQEANDTGSGALGKTSDGLAWDAEGYQIKRGRPGTETDDFVTKSQLDAAQIFGSAVTFPQSWAFTGSTGQTEFVFANGNGGTGPDRANATDPNMFIVEVGGILQRPTTDYTLTVSKITFATAPANGIGIRVRNFGVARSSLDAIPNNSITNQYLASNSVATVNLQDNSVTAPKLADNAVDTASIQNSAVTDVKMATNSVPTAAIQNLAVTEAKIADGSVSRDKIGALAVTNAKIGSGAVTSDKMAANAISFVNMNTQSGVAAFTSGAGVNQYLRVDTSGVLSLRAETLLPVGTPAGDISFSNQFRCTNLAAPINAQDSATKAYVDNLYALKPVVTGILGPYNGSVSTGTFTVNDSSGTPSVLFDGVLYNGGVGAMGAGVRPKVGAGAWTITIYGVVESGAATFPRIAYRQTTNSSTSNQNAAIATWSTSASETIQFLWTAVRA